MNDPNSVIEDLTPDPLPRPGLTRWRDLSLGLLLIVLVVGFAGWQWWHGEDQARNYAAGQTASASHDWQAALDRFTAASGYRDADAQAAAASEKLQQLGTLYEEGMAFARDKNWIAAMQALGSVLELQADYRDTSVTWEEAREEVYKEALEGTAVLRTRNGESDLYVVPGNKYKDFGGWYWMLNSDKYSRVQGGCTDGKILYDVPGKGWSPQSVPSPVPFFVNEPRSSLKGRALVVDSLLTYTDPDFLELPINPSAYDLFLCGRTGMWMYDYGNWHAPDHFPDLNDTPVRNVDTGYSLTYLSFDNTISQTLTFAEAEQAHEVPMAIDYSSNRMVVAKWSGEDPTTRLITENTSVELYLLELDGVSPPRLIYRVKGKGIQSVEISADGNYALVNEFTAVDAPTQTRERESIFLLNLRDRTAPKLLAGTLAYFASYQHNWLASTFIEKGVYAGKVLQSRFDGHGFYLEIIDPASSERPLITSYVEAFSTGEERVSPIYWMVAQENFEGLRLVGREAIRDGSTLIGWALIVVSILPDGTVTTSRTTTAQGWLRGYPFVLAANRLIYVTNVNIRNIDWAVWSTPVSEPEYNGVDAAMIYGLGYADANGSPQLPYDKVTFGSNLMAYIDSGNLHARSYDGKYDVTLGSNISALYGSWRYSWYNNELR